MNMISELFRAIAQSKAWRREQSEEKTERVKANDLFAAGFHAWEYRSPPKNELVECYRIWDGDSFEVVPSQLDPLFNVAGLYWRPARPMKTINGDGPLMVSGEL